MKPLLRHAARGTAIGLVLASTTLLNPTAAQALPVFSEIDMRAGSNMNSSGTVACTTAQNPAPSLSDVPVVENGAATTVAASNSGTLTNNGDATDVLTFATQTSVTGKVTTSNGLPNTMDLVATGSFSASGTKPVSGCALSGYSYGELDFAFTLTQPMIVDITLDATKHTYSEFYLYDDPGSAYVELYGYGLKFSGTQRVYLPAGVYGGYLESDVSPRGIASTTATTPVGASISVDFDVPGSQTAAPVGKAGKYVALPGARSCATDTVDATVTTKKNRAKKIKQISFFVNDKRVSKVKKPKKGTVVKIAVASGVQADVKAVVTEVKKKKGKPGKTYEVEASYEACS